MCRCQFTETEVLSTTLRFITSTVMYFEHGLNSNHEFSPVKHASKSGQNIVIRLLVISPQKYCHCFTSGPIFPRMLVFQFVRFISR